MFGVVSDLVKGVPFLKINKFKILRLEMYDKNMTKKGRDTGKMLKPWSNPQH